MTAEPESATTDTTTAELIAALLSTPDDEDAWRPALVELHRRPTRETFDAATRLLASDTTLERALGVEILGQLGGSGTDPDRAFREETVLLLLDLLAQEHEPRVLEAIGYAFAHLQDPRGVPPLCGLSDHSKVGVRLAVVHGLHRHRDDRAVRALIRLSFDEDAHVRDWATFGLGTQIPLDTPAIRDALVARLDDNHHNTREEAMYGLAMRLDVRAIPVLLTFLEDYEGPMLDSALLVLADHLDDPRLPEAIADRWPDGVPAETRGQADDDYWLATYERHAAG
jgi:HEAT repeat protein